MKKRDIGALVLTLFFLSSCKENEPVYSKFGGFTQGTTYSIVYNDNGKHENSELRNEVEMILQDFDMSLSLYKDSSVLSRINRNETAVPDTYLAEVFRLSQVISEWTGGAFDVTVAPLVKAWGFGPDSKKDMTDSKLDSLLRLVGMEKVKLLDGIIVKSDPRISLDFNAIAQGYSVDVICNYLGSLKIPEFLVEIGGEVRVVGDKGGELWKIGIDRPEDNNMVPGNQLQAIISLKDRSLATSGNYRKFFVEDGIKYSHTIDPVTGYPARNQLLSATVLASDCATADAVATAFMVRGKDWSIDFLESHPEFDAFLIYSDENGDYQIWASEKLKESISETSGE